jgi:Flp pilus assembly protein TadD
MVKATKLDPQNAGLWNNKGLVLEALGRIEEATECYNKAEELGFVSE